MVKVVKVVKVAQGGQGGNILGNLMGSLGGGQGGNDLLGNLMGSLGGGQGGNDILGNLMSSLGGGNGGNDILGNLMGNLTGQGNNGNSSNNSNKSNAKSTSNVKKTTGASAGASTGASAVKDNKTNFNGKNEVLKSKEEVQDNSLANIFSGIGGIDLSQISNMLAGIDLNDANINDMINSLSNGNSLNDNMIFDNNDSNDVEFKHTDTKARTHNLLKNLEDEEMGQLIYILAHLVDDRKLEVLNKIVDENSNLKN